MKPELWNMKYESWNMNPEFWNLQHEIWNLKYMKLGIRNMKSEIWNPKYPKPEIWNMTYGIRNPKPEIWNLKYDTSSLKSGIQNLKSETWSCQRPCCKKWRSLEVAKDLKNGDRLDFELPFALKMEQLFNTAEERRRHALKGLKPGCNLARVDETYEISEEDMKELWQLRLLSDVFWSGGRWESRIGAVGAAATQIQNRKRKIWNGPNIKNESPNSYQIKSHIHISAVW